MDQQELAGRLQRLVMMPFGYNPELIGHAGSSGSFLFYCRDLDRHMAGTVNQLTLRQLPFRIMVSVTQLFSAQRTRAA